MTMTKTPVTKAATKTPAKSPTTKAPAKSPTQVAEEQAMIAASKKAQAERDAQIKAEKDAAKAKEAEAKKAAKEAEKAAKEAEKQAKAEAAAAAKAEQEAVRAEALMALEAAQEAHDEAKAAYDEAKAALTEAKMMAKVPHSGSGTTALLAVRSKSYIRDGEHKTAGGNVSIHCGDAAAQKLLGKSLDECYAIAADICEEDEGVLRSKYGHLNTGMQRMNLGNKIRGVLNAK